MAFFLRNRSVQKKSTKISDAQWYLNVYNANFKNILSKYYLHGIIQAHWASFIKYQICNEVMNEKLGKKCWQ